jgi:hypothetical protein
VACGLDGDLNPHDIVGCGGSNAKQEAGSRENMQTLRETDEQETLPEWKTRGDEDLQEESLLRPEMHGEGDARRESCANSIDAASSEIQRAILRAMRDYRKAPGPSQGQGQIEQPSFELADAVLVLSHALASREWGHSQLSTETAMQCLREAIVSLWPVQHVQNQEEEVWGSIPDEGKRWIVVEAGLRYLNRNRAHRLRCTGNGVVPLQAAQALTTLLDWAGMGING